MLIGYCLFDNHDNNYHKWHVLLSPLSVLDLFWRVQEGELALGGDDVLRTCKGALQHSTLLYYSHLPVPPTQVV